jgi:hypothetical protein
MNISSIEKENFDWKTYLRKYKDIKNIDNIDSAWDHWVNKGKKQGRKFYTLTPDQNNNFYILTKEYKNRKINDNRKNNVFCLSEDFVIEDYIKSLKKKIHKIKKNRTLFNDSENKTNINVNTIKLNDNNSKITENKEKLNDNNSKITENKVKKISEDWSNNSENSDIFFIETNKDENWDNDSKKSELYFNKSNNSDSSSDEKKGKKLNNKIKGEQTNKSNNFNSSCDEKKELNNNIIKIEEEQINNSYSSSSEKKINDNIIKIEEESTNKSNNSDSSSDDNKGKKLNDKIIKIEEEQSDNLNNKINEESTLQTDNNTELIMDSKQDYVYKLMIIKNNKNN